MINLDHGFEKVEAKDGGMFDPPEPGGYVMVCVAVSEEPSKAGNDMVTLSLDIAEGEHAGAFEKFPKRFFQMVNGDNLPYFKGMITHFSASNHQSKMNQVIFQNRDQSLGFNGTALVGLRIGANMREAEYIDKQGQLKIGLEVGQLCAVKDVPALKIMPLKKLKGVRTSASASRPAYADTGSRPPEADSDLPF